LSALPMHTWRQNSSSRKFLQIHAEGCGKASSPKDRTILKTPFDVMPQAHRTSKGNLLGCRNRKGAATNANVLRKQPLSFGFWYRRAVFLVFELLELRNGRSRLFRLAKFLIYVGQSVEGYTGIRIKPGSFL